MSAFISNIIFASSLCFLLVQGRMRDKNVMDSDDESEWDMASDYKLFKKSVGGEFRRFYKTLERLTETMESLNVSQASTSTRIP